MLIAICLLLFFALGWDVEGVHLSAFELGFLLDVGEVGEVGGDAADEFEP